MKTALSGLMILGVADVATVLVPQLVSVAMIARASRGMVCLGLNMNLFIWCGWFLLFGSVRLVI